MAKDLYTSLPVAKNTLDEAVEVLKPLGVKDLASAMFNGPLVRFLLFLSFLSFVSF